MISLVLDSKERRKDEEGGERRRNLICQIPFINPKYGNGEY